uniref:Uncharacterized protein n=1 Tax=Anguilla anguilla TaxID=7936 RepID=A0A0E9WCS3_ANGAN
MRTSFKLGGAHRFPKIAYMEPGITSSAHIQQPGSSDQGAGR